MTVLLVNILLAIPFLFAFIAVPLWMTFKYPRTGPDHTAARQYLRARGALDQNGQVSAALSHTAYQKAA